MLIFGSLREGATASARLLLLLLLTRRLGMLLLLLLLRWRRNKSSDCGLRRSGLVDDCSGVTGETLLHGLRSRAHLLGDKSRSLKLRRHVIGYLGVPNAGHHGSAVHAFGTIVRIAKVLSLIIFGLFVVAVDGIVDRGLRRNSTGHRISHAATRL